MARLIKKYPNRRLYDTETSTYITLADVKQLVLSHEDFHVLDAKSQEDLTRSILLQIILEEEAGGVPMFTDIQDKMKEQLSDSTRQLYDGKGFGAELWSQFLAGQAPMMQSMMGNYMEQSKNMFMQMQEQMQNQTRSMFGNTFNFPGGNSAASGAVATTEKSKK